MYNDSIKINDKIITSKDLLEIFDVMNKTWEQYKKTYYIEEQKNKMLESNYQTWTFKDNGSKLNFKIIFFDESNNIFDNYNDFISIYNNRLNEIKSINVEYYLVYDTDSLKEPRIRYNQSINMDIKENYINIDFNINNQDSKLDDVLNLIKSKISDAPKMKDEILKNKSKIINTISLSIGLIPAMVLLIIFLLIPTINNIFLKGYIVYPICSIIIAIIIGRIISSKKTLKYYDSFKALKQDSSDNIQICEVLIGSNINNINIRSTIINEYNKYKKILIKEIIGLTIISIIVVVIGIFL